MATADLVTTNPALLHGVSPSWRPQPWKRSSAAPPLIAVVAVTAPYTAIETMTAAPTLPRSRGSSVYDWAEPNTRYMMSGSPTMKKMLVTSRRVRRRSRAQ